MEAHQTSNLGVLGSSPFEVGYFYCNKYEMNFKEKLTFYNKIEVSNSIIDNLNEIGQNIELGRGDSRNDINDKCILCKDSNNSQEHVVNECAKTKKLREKLTKELID